MEIDPSGAFYSQTKQAQLGKNDLDKIEIIGELKKLPDYKIPPLGGEAIMNNEAIQEMIHSRALLFPQVAPDLCTACETCIEQCPVSTFSINGDISQVDTDTCITCFCCQEICPEKAITLKQQPAVKAKGRAWLNAAERTHPRLCHMA